MSPFQISPAAEQDTGAVLGGYLVASLVLAGALALPGLAPALADERQPPAPADAAETTSELRRPIPTLRDDSILHVLGGGTWANHQSTFALEVSFEKVLTDFFSLEGVYDNEGHLKDHHRDSLAIQLFAQRRVLNDRVRLRVGLGPQLYFDTKVANTAEGNTDAHGIGLLASVAAELELVHGVFAEGRVNGSVDQADFASGQVLLGLGYHLGPPDQPDANTEQRHNLFFALGGQSIRNSFASERGTAVMVGVEREDILACVGASGSYLRLGSLNGRQGVALQLSAQQRFFDNRFIVGAGVGPYLYVDSANNNHSDIQVAGLVGARIGYAVIANVEVLVSLIREFGNQDYDVVLAGLGAKL